MRGGGFDVYINNKIGITNIVPNNCHFVKILGHSFRKSYTLAVLKHIDISHSFYHIDDIQPYLKANYDSYLLAGIFPNTGS